MKRFTVLAAAFVILVANVWTYVSATLNRGDAPGGTIELTERELLLPEATGDSTAILLELDWDTLHAPTERRGAADWLDAAKLVELGLDPRLPGMLAEDPDLDYSELSIPVFVVLEYEGPAWRQAPPERERSTRLLAIDAGLDPGQLRERYADPGRYVIARGVVDSFVQELPHAEGEPPPPPRVHGILEGIQPSHVFVPRPHNRILEDARRRGNSARDHEDDRPRFCATVSWGRRYEPWIESVRQPAASD